MHAFEVNIKICQQEKVMFNSVCQSLDEHYRYLSVLSEFTTLDGLMNQY